ncbi:MAG: M20/M25/M40 family metallo-hydrolase [Mariniblastus sp.]|nr:M20/M25/M40 family metallo-hydrolase [Mariniblastus sp.]
MNCIQTVIRQGAVMKSICFALGLSLLLGNSFLRAQETNEPATPSPAAADTEIQKIIQIGTTDNQVQVHLDYLTNRIGARLTGSEGMQAACEWARGRFEEMGLSNCRLEKWGEFPVGFERGPSSGVMLEPKPMKLEFGTNAWTAGTRGRVPGMAVMAPKTMKELESMRESLDGAYVLTPPRRRGRRGRREPPAGNEDGAKLPSIEETRQVREELMKCKIAGIVQSTSDERILTGGRYDISMDDLPTIPVINLLKTQWDEIRDLIEEGEKVELAFDIRNHFRRGPIPLSNVIAEIPGSEFPNEYVVVGGHIDSWDGATGATDNASGCATTLEAARILMAAGIQPKRTIRFMLWSGEEQGLLGSKAWVQQNPKQAQNISAVFVHDGGTNYVSGITCTAAMQPDFEQIFADVMQLDERTPFAISTIDTMRPRGGSDHVPFIAAGIPGFFWNQSGRATYRTTHHTQYDTFETVVPEYQKHSALVIAVGALGTANLDHLLPRDGIQN